ncbi:ABC transporter ATP-binding protein [Pontimicrobium sp. SW4]|uniref:ABC transporter ATP-binding protein n=1 Tax=Pontimicrobium sp. SW4 TaxID=3153519 RepID=A0AAU7BV35_9FLAO
MIQINNLRFNYPNGKTILNDLTLHLESGKIYGLFGRNGEGKSTLIKLMAGLLFSKSGTCLVKGEDVSKRSASALQDIFVIPENFELSALKIATFEKVNSVFYPKFSREQFYELIQEFKLLPTENISNLSFGQKKKVLIAFGISANTKLLLMDEPTNGLDIPSKSQFRKILASVINDEKCIVISTHQVRDLHNLIDHVIILDQTKVLFDQSLSKISEHLWFGKTFQNIEDSFIYSDVSFGGKAIHHRKDKDETEVDLELLFNAALSKTETINNALKNSYRETTV